MSDVNGGVPEPEASEIRQKIVEVRTNNMWATRFQIALVALTAAGMLATSIFSLWTITEVRRLGRANQRQLEANAAGAQFSIDAVNCVRYMLAEHRWVNEGYHARQANALGIAPVDHAPLPVRPTSEQINRACVRFDVSSPEKVPTVTTGGKR